MREKYTLCLTEIYERWVFQKKWKPIFNLQKNSLECLLKILRYIPPSPLKVILGMVFFQGKMSRCLGALWGSSLLNNWSMFSHDNLMTDLVFQARTLVQETWLIKHACQLSINGGLPTCYPLSKSIKTNVYIPHFPIVHVDF